jgi:protein-disulfide isomerase
MTDQKAIIIEFQYFEGCRNSDKMKNRVKGAIGQISSHIIFKEVLVENQEISKQLKFRGSPTVLINGIDLEKMPESLEGNLACRHYINGLPTIEEIKNLILSELQT